MAEVAVVGAGVHGASAAFHLASRGVKVTVIERGGAASGPTGRSSAICRAYYTNRYLARVAKNSLDMFRSFSELTRGRECDFHAAGALYLHPDADAAGLAEAARYMNSIGTSVKVIAPEQLHDEFPLVDPEGIGISAWEENAGYADPVATTAGLLARAVDLGATARLHVTAVRLQERSGGGAVLSLANGDEVECLRLLIAAGPWTKGLAAELGVALPLAVERHYVATIRWPRAAEMPWVHADVAGGYYCKPEGVDQYCVGPLTAEPEAEPDAEVAGIQAEESHRMAALATHRVPALRDAVSTGGWASLYDVSPDWMPVIGEIAPGVFVDAGTSGHGFKLAPALGADVAGLVLGAEVERDLGQFSPARFGSGEALAAGYGSARILG
ncbi:MAG TPA: FAD-binding oxidoreductase [Candidatus Dormibacteraeota bacterium]